MQDEKEDGEFKQYFEKIKAERAKKRFEERGTSDQNFDRNDQANSQSNFDDKQSYKDFKQERQKTSGNQSSSKNQQQNVRSGSRGSIVQLPPQIAKDLTLMNLPKFVSKPELKKQYHKLAKMYHPDILNSPKSSMIPEQQKKRLEDKFKEFNQAYERLVEWIESRDATLDSDLSNNLRSDVRINKQDGSVTYSFGKLQIEGKASQIDKKKILLEMVEEDMDVREPRNLRRYLILVWISMGIYAFRRDAKKYIEKMKEPIEGLDYNQYFNNTIIKRVV
eukprot:403368398